MKKTLLAIAILTASAAVQAGEAATTPTAVVYGPFGYAPVTLTQEQVQQIVAQQQKAYQAAFEAQRQAYEQYAKYQADQMKAVLDDQKQQDAEREKMSQEIQDQMTDVDENLREAIYSGNRDAVDKYFAERAKEMDTMFAAKKKELDAAHEQFDEIFAKAREQAPVAPVAPF